MHRCAVHNQRHKGMPREPHCTNMPIAKQKIFNTTANDCDINQLRLILASSLKGLNSGSDCLVEYFGMRSRIR